MSHALYDQTLKLLADSDPTGLLWLLDALPRDTRVRVGADRATVEVWGKRVLDAVGVSLDELLT